MVDLGENLLMGFRSVLMDGDSDVVMEKFLVF